MTYKPLMPAKFSLMNLQLTNIYSKKESQIKYLAYPVYISCKLVLNVLRFKLDLNRFEL